jgi:RNA polymerase sigma-70 factor (ECF subfamily)
MGVREGVAGRWGGSNEKIPSALAGCGFPVENGGGMETRRTLLERVRSSSDHLAWDEFVALYGPLVFRFARGRGAAEADAADVSQEVMRVVARVMPDFEYDPARGSFRSWLYTVTRRQLARHFRREARGRRIEVPDEGDDGGFREAWDAEWRRHLLDRAVRRVKAQFGEGQWAAFWRTAVEEKEPAAVAAELGMSREAVYMARSRVTARMREVLGESGADGGNPMLDPEGGGPIP